MGDEGKRRRKGKENEWTEPPGEKHLAVAPEDQHIDVHHVLWISPSETSVFYEAMYAFGQAGERTINKALWHLARFATVRGGLDSGDELTAEEKQEIHDALNRVVANIELAHQLVDSITTVEARGLLVDRGAKVRKCDQCGTTFPYQRRTRKYCSNACQQKARRARRQE